MLEEEIRAALNYVVNSSRKEVDFIHHKISKQVQAGHAVISLLASACGLSNFVDVPSGRHPTDVPLASPHFYYTWNVLNKATARKATEEVIRFGVTLHRIIHRVLMSNPSLGPVYLGEGGPRQRLHAYLGLP